MLESCLMEKWKYTVQRCLESVISLDCVGDKVILAIYYCVYLTLCIVGLWLGDRGGWRGSEAQHRHVERLDGGCWCCSYHWSGNNGCSSGWLQCIFPSAAVSSCILFLRDSLLRAVSAFCIIWSEFSAYQNKHVINPAMEISVSGFPFANWLYGLTARAFGWFLHPAGLLRFAAIQMPLKQHLLTPNLLSAWDCINSYVWLSWDWSFSSGSFWRLTQFFSPSLKMTQRSYWGSFCQSPLEAHWISPFLFPTGLSGSVLQQAICQLHYQFLSVTLAQAAFDELDMWGRLLNVMFVNVPSVQITEMLTWFFCSWEYLFLLLFLILLKELASMTLFSFVKQMLWYLDPCSLFLLFQLCICYILKSI